MPVELLVLLLAALAVLAVLAYQPRFRRRRKAPGRRTRRRGRSAPDPSAPGYQRVAVVLNPVKGRSREALELLQRGCLDAGLDPPLVLETRVDDPGRSMTRRAVASGADVVIAAGGDGTVRIVAQELTGTGVLMGVLPLGTANLLARNLGMNVNNLQDSVRTALHGIPRRIDTGSIRLENAGTEGSSTHTFLVMAGIGLDADVIAHTQDELKRRFGWLAYGEAGVRRLPGRRRPMDIRLDDGEVQQRNVQSVLFVNCGLLPGGIDFVPAARLDDGYLDVVLVSPRSAAGWVWIAGKTVLRHRGNIPAIEYHRARKIRVSTADPTGTQLDGDLSGEVTALTVEIRPSALLIRAPEGIPG